VELSPNLRVRVWVGAPNTTAYWKRASLRGLLTGEKGEPLWRLVDSMSPHLSNVDVVPFKEGTTGIHPYLRSPLLDDFVPLLVSHCLPIYLVA
jgi:hypothetical protein